MPLFVKIQYGLSTENVGSSSNKMKQCDHLATIASSSPSFPPSESDPDDSFWRDFTFDFSFLTSDDHKTVPKGEIDFVVFENIYQLGIEIFN